MTATARSTSTDLSDLYRGYWDALLENAVYLVDNDRAGAEDVVQETLLRAWRSGLENVTDVRPWLFRVQLNVVRSLHRNRTRVRRGGPGGGEVAEDLACATARVGTRDHANAVVASVMVRDALAVLTDLQRVVIAHRYLFDFTARETGRRVGYAEGSVGREAWEGLRSMRRHLEGHVLATPPAAGDAR